EQADVGDELEEQLDIALDALLARLPFTRRLVGRRGEVLVAAPPVPALGDEDGLARLEQLGEQLARVSVTQLGARRHGQVDVLGRLAAHVLALAVRPALRLPQGVIAVVEQRGEVRVGANVHAAARSTVTAIRPTLRHELFPPKGTGSRSTCSRSN